jgi:predicted ester cyclase
MSATEDRNMATVRRVHDEVNRGNVNVFDEVLSADYARHCQAMPPGAQELRGAEPLKAFVREHLVAIPDWYDTIDLMFAAGDMVAYVTTGTGTQTGPLGPLPVTGKGVRLVSVIIHRFDGEKIAETWISWDNVAFLSQLGLMPEPGGAARAISEFD